MNKTLFVIAMPMKRSKRIACSVSVTPGYVYLFKVKGIDLFKIGRTNNLKTRLSELQVGCPYVIHYVHACFTGNCVETERSLHRKYESCQTSGEWFVLSADQVKEVVATMTLQHSENLMHQWINTGIDNIYNEQKRRIHSFFKQAYPEGGTVKASQAYEAYLLWCKSQDIAAENLITFGKTVQNLPRFERTRTSKGWMYQLP